MGIYGNSSLKARNSLHKFLAARRAKEACLAPRFVIKIIRKLVLNFYLADVDLDFALLLLTTLDGNTHQNHRKALFPLRRR